MADIGRMNIEETQAAISNFNSKKGEFESVVNALGNVMYDLSGTWTGDAAQAFDTRFREMKNNLQTILQSMEGSVGKLQTAINDYMATEEAQTAGINAVNTTAAPYSIQG